MNILNVDSTYGTFNSNDPRFQQGLIDDTIRQSDLKVVQAVLVSNNPLRLQYLQPITVGDKQPLPGSVGPYGPVLITRSDSTTVEGVRTTKSTIEQLRSQSSFYSGAEGYYSIDDSMFRFTGQSAQIYCGRVPDNSTNLQAPDSLEDAIVYLTVSALYAKLEDSMNAAQYYGELAKSLLSVL